MKALFLSILALGMAFGAQAQKTDDEKLMRKIWDFALTESDCYENLRYLCKEIGPRLSGSEGAAKSVEWSAQVMRDMGLDTVWLQPVMVPHWVRGGKEEGEMILPDGSRKNINICALGGSIGTPDGGLEAEIIEVFRIEDLESIGRENIEGKIVFFNRPMDPLFINTFHSYGGCVDQRTSGAAESAPFGAAAILVRSMNLRYDELPHTGVSRYKEGVRKIPAAAVSTMDAERLSDAIAAGHKVKVRMQLNCEIKPDALSYNVIGEIKGSEFPEQIITVGGHIDSWDISEGAHDDGAGCVQSMEVMNTMIKMGIKPKRTIRCVMFMNEENGARGAAKYAEEALKNKEIHVAALESDRGGFTPRGFTIDGLDAAKALGVKRLHEWAELLEPYDLHSFKEGYSGVDINYLKSQGPVLFGFVPDSQRYFDHHHAENDNFEAVNKRELELGAASMTALIYLVDRDGLTYSKDIKPLSR